MDPSYNFPHHTRRQQDEYALTILTQAAMQRNSKNNTNSNSNATISNYPNQHHQINSLISAESSRDTPIISTTSVTSSTISNQQNDTAQYRVAPSLSNLVGDYTGTQHPAMETLIFNPTQQIPQSAYMQHPFQPTYPSSLGILSAEKYDDGSSDLRSMTRMEGHSQQQRQQQSQIPFGMLEKNHDELGTRSPPSDEPEHGTKRKRKTRNEVQIAEDEEEARKRARGRPRVDPKDESAADRRRTQIRMAQRAYRHRKETTISSLEKQVQDLRGTNEEMSNIFINLYDFAMSRNLLQREPEFGHQLQSATQRFLTLAKQSTSEDNSRDEDDAPEEISQQPHKEPEQALTRRGKTRRSSPKAPKTKEPTIPDMVNPWGGYTVSKDTSSEEDRQSGYTQQNSSQRDEDVQIVSRATEDNASFLFNPMDIQQYRVEIPSPTIEDFSQSFYPQASLPLPSTHTYYELSFARRVHRAAIERGFRLITAKNPNKKRFQEVFGFCLLYESRERIAERFRGFLSHSTKDSLHEWRAPFVHLGGAGTHYPNQEADDLMPKFRTGLSMGPFSTSVTPAQENLDSDMRCTLPGFEGEFFDPNDVEGYLKSHGFHLSPAADFITGEVDLVALGEVASPRTMSTDTAFPPTPRSPVGRTLEESNQDIFGFNYFNDNSGKDSTSKMGGNFPPGFMTFSSWETDISNSTESNPLNLLFDEPARLNTGEGSFIDNSRRGDKRIITISVDVLIEGLVSRASCLGRTPGFRPSDVNAAIVAAAKQAGF